MKKRTRAGQVMLEQTIALALVTPAIFITFLLLVNTSLAIIYKEKLSAVANQTAFRLARYIRQTPPYLMDRKDLKLRARAYADEGCRSLGLDPAASVEADFKNNRFVVIKIIPGKLKILSAGIFPTTVKIEERGCATFPEGRLLI